MHDFRRAIGNYFDKNSKAIKQCMEAEVEYLQTYKWLNGVFILIFIFIFSSFAGLVLTRPDMKAELSFLEGLRSESVSPNTYNIGGAVLIFLSSFIFWSSGHKKFVGFVSYGLMSLSYGSALMFGLMYGEVSYWIAVSGEGEVPIRIIVFIPVLILFSIFLFLFTYMYSVILSPRSREYGLLSNLELVSPGIRMLMVLMILSSLGYGIWASYFQ